MEAIGSKMDVFGGTMQAIVSILVVLGLFSSQSQAGQPIELESLLSKRLVTFNLLNKVSGVESGKAINVTGEMDCIFKMESSGVMPYWCDVRVAGKTARLRHLREDWDVVRVLEKNFSVEPPFENDNPRRMRLDFKLTASEKHEDIHSWISQREKRDVAFDCNSDDAPNRWAAKTQLNEKLDQAKVILFAKEGGSTEIPKELSIEGGGEILEAIFGQKRCC